jgi:hypothetical protein
MTELSKRMEKLERLLNADRPSGTGPISSEFLAVLVYGGLTPLPAVASDDTGHEWIRDVAAAESVEDFAQRAARESRGHGARLCTIGGMGRDTPSQTEALRAAWDEYMLHEYSDVPPVETRTPARSRLGYAGD